MKKVFIVHGLMSGPENGWKPWLVNQLNKDGIPSVALSMPDTNNPKKEDWVNAIKKVLEKNKAEEVILVGHSLGATTILRFLEESNSSLLGIVLVSGAVKQINSANFVIQNILKRFVGTEFNWDKIRSNIKSTVVVHAIDDPKVPVEHAQIIAGNLKVTPILLQRGGHLSGRDNCTELPEVLEAIKKTNAQ